MSSPSPPPRRERRPSPSVDDRDIARTSKRRDRDDDGRRHRRRASRSPDPRSKHTHSRQPASPVDEDRSSRRHHRDRSRERRHRSSSRRRYRSRSRDTSRERRRQREDRPERRRDRSTSPRSSRRSKYGRSRSPKRRRPSRSTSPASRRSKKPLPSQEDAYHGDAGEVDRPVEKQKPNFSQTGLLAKEANTVAGTNIVLKYNEPADARKPPAKDAWRLYVFKGQDLLDTIELAQRSCWLIGREAAVADLLVEHPSTSKQHAVIQFRHTTRTNEFGDRDAKVRPYLIDLESSNGTVLNGNKIEATRYVEIMDKDVIKFGESQREYVLMLPPPDS